MNKYKISLKQQTTENELNSIEFEFENHDDLFRIISIMKESENFKSEQEAIQFGIGLKLFSAVMMNNRESELFKDFEPAFIEFMKKLKGKKG